MFVVNDDNSIYATRGDIVYFGVTAEDKGKNYKFQPGDVLRMKVYGKKDAENVVLQKDFPVSEITEKVDIHLTGEDTKFGDVISKPRDYWYEVELNPDTEPQTIVGYDEDGAKLFKLFPEGDDVPPYVPKPEDIPVVDDELDMTSPRPVQNQVIARELINMRDECERTRAAVTELHVTPEMFGAIGDGVSDDTDAFAEMVRTNPSAIFIPDRSYRVTQVDFSGLSNCRVNCSGRFVNGNATDIYGVVVVGGRDNVFDGLKIDGNASAYSETTARYGEVCALLVNTNAERCTVRNTLIENTQYCGVIFNDGVTNCKFYDTRFKNIGEHCFYIGGADGILFDGIEADTWGNNTLCISSGHDCEIIKQANRASARIKVRNVTATSESGCMAYGFNVNDCDGFEVDGIAFETDRCLLISGQSVTGFKVSCAKVGCDISASYFNGDAVFSACELAGIGTIAGKFVFNDCHFTITYAEIRAAKSVEFNNCRFDFVSSCVRLYQHNGITFNNCAIISHAETAQGMYMFTEASGADVISDVALNNCKVDSTNYSGGFYGNKKINLRFNSCDLSKLVGNIGIVDLTMNNCVCANALAWSGWASETAHGSNVKTAAGVSTTKIRKTVTITKGNSAVSAGALRYTTFRKCAIEDVILMNTTDNTCVYADLVDGTDNQTLRVCSREAAGSDIAVVVIIDLNE